MDTIFHEKQEGSLCAQHCLNALLQGSYFSAVDLADIGRQLDETERNRMAEAGVDTQEFRTFLTQDSTNFDDSGFFSIQVLQQALQVWDLELLLYNSSTPVAEEARKDPRTQTAYICNFREHWFCIRKLGNQWFNLNSLLNAPEVVSDTYLHMYLLQLQQEGYSIFIVRGNLPHCEADDVLKFVHVEPAPKSSTAGKGNMEDLDPEVQVALMESQALADGDEGTATLQAVLAESRAEAGLSAAGDEEADLARAIQLSLQAGGSDIGERPSTSGATAGSSTPPSCSSSQQAPDPDELRRQRLAFFEKGNQGNQEQKKS